MRMTLTASLLRTTCLSATAFFGLAQGAPAGTILGGGSTLAEQAYKQIATITGGPTLKYCGVGSGSGQAANLGNSVSKFLETTLKTGDASICTTLSSLQTYPVAFGASDATLSASQISGYSRSSTDGPLIQVPTFGTPITIPAAGTQVTSNSKVTLTETDLCGIFAGGYTNWSSTSASSTLTGSINVVYRLDGSGTSFLLTNHLATVCPSLTFPKASGFTSFSATTSFASLFSTVPSNFSSATGSQGVQTALDNAKTGSTATLVGYLSPDYTSLVGGTIPTSDSTLYVASVKNGNNNTAYQPDFTSTSSALNSGSLSVPSTAAQASSQASWVPVIPNPTTGYPIVGYTTIDTVTCFASSTGTTATDVTNFLGDIYNNAQGAGFITTNGFVPLPATLNSAVLNTFVNNSTYTANGSTVGPWGLNIGNTSVCTGTVTGRPNGT